MAKRKPGISVLISTQNEEAMISLCIRSFLDFGDELIVVDNGSTDRTKEIVRELASRYPEKIKFYDVPELPDLYHNRQYAFEHSCYQWIVRTDGDFVAYTEGDYDIMRLREYLLSHGSKPWPLAISVNLPNVSGDLWHTGAAVSDEQKKEKRYIPVAMTGHRPRIYRYLPFFRFKRHGRWEVARYHYLYLAGALRWDKPIWMHCNLKSDMSHFLRSERTNWRQLGDFERFPTLLSYIESVVEEKYGTAKLEEAARIYMERVVLPHLERYDPEKYHPYPSLAAKQMEENPIYKILKSGDKVTREYFGVD
ncbi:MAG: glycosyltransferase family 2 protein [Planctomycetota bacterium]|jgi:glycosyltransferase involved in cell wall biosynthesis